MNTLAPIIINNVSYIKLADLCKLQASNTSLNKGPYHIIKKFNFIKNKDYFFFVENDDSWIPADGSIKKIHKAFALLSCIMKMKSLAKFVNQGKKEPVKSITNESNNKEPVKNTISKPTNKEPVKNTVSKQNNNDNSDNNDVIPTDMPIDEPIDVILKYPVINLSENEKFKDKYGKIFNVETRGFKKHTQIYFRVKHVGLYFNIKNLRSGVSDSRSSYEKNTDYIYIDTSNSNKTMFFTYLGLIRCLFVSRSKETSNFIDWSIKTLFTVQFGTDKQKNKLISNIKGISYDIVHDLFARNARALPCIYLTSVNTAGNLRNVMDIDEKHDDTAIICKFGLTQNFGTRTKGHKNDFKDIADNVDLKLILYTYIDPVYLNDAENDLIEFCKDIQFNYKNHQEIVIISQSYFKNVKVFFEKLGYKYSEHTAQFNKQITELNGDINNLQSVVTNNNLLIENIKKQHELELDKMNLELDKKNLELDKKNLELATKELEIKKNEELYQAKLESISKNEELFKAKLEILQLQLQYKELLLQK